MKRDIAMVVRRVRTADLNEDAERRAYWLGRPAPERIAEVEALRRLWPSLTGDPDVPMVKVIHRRRLGEAAIQRPSTVQPAAPQGPLRR